MPTESAAHRAPGGRDRPLACARSYRGLNDAEVDVVVAALLGLFMRNAASALDEEQQRGALLRQGSPTLK